MTTGYRLLTVAFLTSGIAGCGIVDSLITVDAPSRVLADDLNDPKTAALMTESAITDFECAFARYILAGAMVGEEFSDAQGSADVHDYDRRSISPSRGIYATLTCSDNIYPGVYKPLSTARWQADNILTRLDGWTDAEVTNRTTLIATAAAYAGYSYVMIGEAMCSAAFDLGPEQTPAQVFGLAEQRFARAMTVAQTVSSPSLLNMARVGRARARLNLGRAADAATDAALVPTDFVRMADYSSVSSRTENAPFVVNNRINGVTVGEAYRALSVGGVPDTRVRVVDAGRGGFDPLVRLWLQQKYAAATTGIPIASGDEAQLIVAEAAVSAGNIPAAVAIINTLHTRAGLPVFGGTTATETRNQIIYERRAELFLESQHFADLRRYDLPLVPAPGTPYRQGGQYGNMRCFPLPALETSNNPNIDR